MVDSVNFNYGARLAAFHFGNNSRAIDNIQKRMATGQISAMDDPSGAALVNIMESEVACLGQALRNIAQGAAMLNMTSAKLDQTSQLLIRGQEVLTALNNTTLSDVQRTMLLDEIRGIFKSIDDIANISFNDLQLLNGGNPTYSMMKGAPVQSKVEGAELGADTWTAPEIAGYVSGSVGTISVSLKEQTEHKKGNGNGNAYVVSIQVGDQTFTAPLKTTVAVHDAVAVETVAGGEIEMVNTKDPTSRFKFALRNSLPLPEVHLDAASAEATEGGIEDAFNAFLENAQFSPESEGVDIFGKTAFVSPRKSTAKAYAVSFDHEKQVVTLYDTTKNELVEAAHIAKNAKEVAFKCGAKFSFTKLPKQNALFTLEQNPKTGQNVSMQIGSKAADVLEVTFADMSAIGLGLDQAHIAADTPDQIIALSKIMEDALTTVDTQKGYLSACQEKLQERSVTEQISIDQTQSAVSAIRDTSPIEDLNALKLLQAKEQAAMTALIESLQKPEKLSEMISRVLR